MAERITEEEKKAGVRQPFMEWLRRHRVELLLFALLWGSYAYFYQATGDNECVRLDQLRALVEDHTLKIDQYWWNTADVIHYPPQNGSVFPNKAPGTTFLLAIPYAVVAGALTPLRHFGVPEWLYWHLVIYVLTVSTISLWCAFAGVAMLRVLVQLTQDRYASLLAILAVWLGTLLFPFATLFFSHAVAAAFLVFAFYLLFQLRGTNGTPTKSHLTMTFGAAFFLSGSVLCEYPSAVAVAVITLYAVWIAWRWNTSLATNLRFAAAYAAGAMIGIGLLIGYNLTAFGKAFYIPYESYARAGSSFYSTYAQGWMGMHWSGWSHFFQALGAILLFPPIGLLYLKLDGWRIYACNPVLWLAIPGIILMAWKRVFRPEGFLVIGLTIAYLLFLTSYGSSIYDWSGASYLGPRHLIPLLPFLALPLCLGARKLPWLFYPLLGLSIFYMLLGTAVEPRVPFPFEFPARDLLLPDYLHGKLSQNAHHLFDSGEHLITRDSTAFNLAKLAGLPGRLQLAPLMLWWAVLGIALLLVTRESRRLVGGITIVLFTAAIGFTPMLHQAVAGPKNTNHGLLGKYYRNATWSGKPVEVQIDPAVDFDWSKSLPMPPPFSIEWTGHLFVEQPGEYEFALIADDGASLSLDNQTIIGATTVWQEKTTSLELNRGLHPIRVRYFNNLFGGTVHLSWMLTGRPKQIIPSEALVPDPLPNDEKATSAK